MLDFKDAHYVISAPKKELRPNDPLPEIVFLGKSNVGKSTFINNLAGQKVAYSSKKAGKTKLLNYFLVDSKFFLVDSPGYGYTEYGSRLDTSFADMMEGYFDHNEYLKGAVLLVDSRRGLSDDDNLMVSFLKKNHVPYILIFTKSDIAKQSELARCRKESVSYTPVASYFSPRFSDVPTLRKSILSLLN
jgi:GTP-binding protein